ncbi:MAG: hypothetical protein M3Z85_03660 [Acidobacteriota bacterium]|nr:hypothetical protein [Acidobacteriota bacterium]
MKSKRVLLIAGAAMFAIAARAQDPGSEVHFYKYVGPAAGMPAPPPLTSFPQTFEYIQTDGFSGGKAITGSPYTADETSETTQTLADGNRIVRKSTSQIYRDKDGRTRTETAFPAFGPMTAAGEAHKTILINDTVAGVTYRLEPDSHVAVKMPALNLQDQMKKQMVEKKMAEANASGGNLRIVSRAGAGAQLTLETQTIGKLTAESKALGAKTEPLGKRTIEGVDAEGTRTTTTIPAGQIGNEQPIEIVSERWFSPDLQTLVLTSRKDPMAGETIYKLSNITRADPDPSLFQVPAGYTIRDGPARMEGIGNVRFIRKEQ